MKKSIHISDFNWKFLTNIKTEYSFKTLDEVMDILVIHCADSLKRGDLELYKAR